jgi:general secretion pathway protein D
MADGYDGYTPSKAGIIPVRAIPRGELVKLRSRLAAIILALTLIQPGAWAQGIPIKEKISVPGGQAVMTLRLRGSSPKEALQMIADQRKINLTLDDSVPDASGPDLDFFNTPVNQILESILLSNGLEIQAVGSTYVVYRSGRYGRPVIRFIPLSFANAASVSSLLGGVLDSQRGNAGRPLFPTRIRPDTQSNGLIVSGQAEDIQTVEKLVKRMDVLLPSRVFPINHLTVPEAIEILKGSFFIGASSAAAATPAAGGEAATAEAAGTQRSAIVKSTFRDFAGTAPGVLPQTKTENVTVTEQTPRFVPLGQQNGLLVIGSQSELALVEQILKAVDRKRPQVIIRTQIVQIEQGALDRIGLSYGLGGKQFSGDFDANAGPDNGRFSFDTITNQAANLKIALDALVTQKKAKVLASPSVLAMDSRSSIIRIVDDIIESSESQISTPANGIPVITRSITKGVVGITLELTPRIDHQGGITMNVHPIISFVKGEERSPSQDLIATLKSTREFQTQEIRVQDGQTIVIGGLIQDSSTQDIEKIPLLGDIPFLGALFRRKTNNQIRNEVQIFITPEIVKDVAA